VLADDRVALYFREHGSAALVDAESVSDGLLHALAVIAALSGPGQGTPALEEPENALHPWAVAQIVRMAQDSPQRQVVLTTHSDAVVDAIVDPSSLVLVERGPTGTHAVHAASREQMLTSILAESGIRLGELWLGARAEVSCRRRSRMNLFELWMWVFGITAEDDWESPVV
jgi:predicted ATPase